RRSSPTRPPSRLRGRSGYRRSSPPTRPWGCSSSRTCSSRCRRRGGRWWRGRAAWAASWCRRGGVAHGRHHGAAQVQASGRKVVAGTGGLGGIVVPAVGDTTAPFVTVGGYVEEQVGVRDRLYVTAAM